MIAIAAWFGGVWRVVRSPWLVAFAYVLLLVATVPLGLLLHRDLPPSSQPTVVEPGAGPAPNVDWLEEVTAGRGGLLGTLSPTVVGVAAPLDNLDRLLDARHPPLFAVALAAVSLIVWSWLWGGIISLAASTRRRFFAACAHSFTSILKVSVIGVGAAIVLYLTLHPLLFRVVWPAVTAGASERIAFAWRVALVLPFVVTLTLSTLIADYARISIVLNDSLPIGAAIRNALAIVRHNAIAVLVLVVLSAVLLAGLLVVYGAFEFIPGGSVPTLGRVILLGQAFVVTRLVLRCVNAAAQVLLYQRITRRAAIR